KRLVDGDQIQIGPVSMMYRCSTAGLSTEAIRVNVDVQMLAGRGSCTGFRDSSAASSVPTITGARRNTSSPTASDSALSTAQQPAATGGSTVPPPPPARL